MEEEYRNINLGDGTYIQVKYDVEGVVYDKFTTDGEHIETIGYDLYHEIPNIVELNNRAK